MSDPRASQVSHSRIILAATDPAQPYGAALPWPESDGRPARAAGAHVVLIDGELAAYLERGGHSMVTFAVDGWAAALTDLVARGRYRSLEIRKVNGEPVREVVAAAEELRQAGFVDGYKGLVYRGPKR